MVLKVKTLFKANLTLEKKNLTLEKKNLNLENIKYIFNILFTLYVYKNYKKLEVKLIISHLQNKNQKK